MGLDSVHPAFTPLPSELSFGPPADISMGWDGTVWAIDTAGAPHLYDPVENSWQPHGGGVDAAAAVGDSTLYLFRGSEVLTVDLSTMTAGAPRPISAAFPSLPHSFTLGVAAAAWTGDKLILFNGGWWVPADGSGPPAKVTSVAGWPTGAAWADGVVDTVIPIRLNEIYLVRGAECILVNFVGPQLIVGSAPVRIADVLPAALADGVDAAALSGIFPFFYFRGPSVGVTNFPQGPVTTSYLPAVFSGWPAAWNPVLRHAPSGRDGNLWSVLPAAHGSYIMQHDGTTWTQQPDQADHVSAGRDDTVMIASASRLWRYAGGTQFVPLAPLNGLIQVSVGGQDTVYGLDTGNTVHSFSTTDNTFTAVTAAGQAVDMAANADGTLWHAKPGDPNMHRYLSDINVLQPGIPVQQGAVTAVHKVAATGFGSAYCLAQDTTGATKAYAYGSPYLFKTGAPYTLSGSDARPVLASGLGQVFFTNVEVTLNSGFWTTTVIALDAHTGQELSRSAPLASSMEKLSSTHGVPVVDESNGLVYVNTQNAQDVFDQTLPGTLLALDAKDLTRVVWSFETPSSIDAAPAIIGSTLMFSDRGASFYAFDLSATLAGPAHPAPAVTWHRTMDGAPPAGAPFSCTTPVKVGDAFYSVAWQLGTSATLVNSATLVCLTTSQSEPVWRKALYQWHLPPLSDTTVSLAAPIVGRTPLPGGAGLDIVPPLYVAAGNAILLTKPDGSVAKFGLPATGPITTGLGWDAEAQQLWFGSGDGRLYGLDSSLAPVAGTPVSPAGQTPDATVSTTPVICRAANGGTTVLTGCQTGTTPYLYGFTPGSGNLSVLPTGDTELSTLSQITNGIIYAGGTKASDLAGRAQMFGIRVDRLVQGLRDFIIESQLMQDPDETAAGSGSTDPGNLIPPSVARYQTHLTVVDDRKSPLPRQAVKIWADVAGTAIVVDGRAATVGPGDSDFVAATTGPDGSLVIVSDATDINASALRVWASFMDPYERIVVYPDHEWHARVSQAYADPAGSVTAPDPGRPNLSTVHSYTGTQLFTDQQKSRNSPQAVAGAIGQMTKGVNPGGPAPASLAGTLMTLSASSPDASYVAYQDLAGMHYAATNARASRPAAVAQPVGLRLTVAQDQAHSYTPLSAADARAAADGLTGTPWSGGPAPAAGLGNIFTDFWNWLKGAAAEITQIVVSVAEDVVVGIQLLVNGAETVFRAVVRSVEDVVNAIGSFFRQLIHDIEEVIQALSVLFHFGEIIATHNWLKAQFTAQVTTLKRVLVQQSKPAADEFFTLAEAEIAAFVDQVKSKFGPAQPLNQVQGAGTTVHTAMSAAPGQPLGGTSQAVQGSWGIRKFQSGLPAATPPPAPAAPEPPARGAAETGDPIGDFVSGFLASLENNATLKQSSDQLRSDFSRLITPSTAGQFFTSLVDTFLDILKELLVGALAIGQAFMDGMFNVIEDVIQLIMDHVLTQPLNIPVLTWLYQKLFGEQLTILDAVTLVAAIPVTVLFRIITGQYPSQAMVTTQSGQAGTAALPAVGAAPPWAQDLMAILAGILFIAYGMFSGLSDLGGSTPEQSNEFTFTVLSVGFLIVLVTLPLITSDTSSNSDWLAYGIGAIIAFTPALGVQIPPSNEQLIPSEGLSFITCALCVFLVFASARAYVNDKDRSVAADLGLAGSIIGSVPGILNPLKYVPSLELGLAVVVVADLIGNFSCGGLQFAVFRH